MSYKGEVIATTAGGVEVRRLTPEEYEQRNSGLLQRSGVVPPEMRYCLVGESHWNPADWFERYAQELEDRAKRFHEAAAIIAKDRGENAPPLRFGDLVETEAGRAVVIDVREGEKMVRCFLEVGIPNPTAHRSPSQPRLRADLDFPRDEIRRVR